MFDLCNPVYPEKNNAVMGKLFFIVKGNKEKFTSINLRISYKSTEGFALF
jgi:hypothetical protein